MNRLAAVPPVLLGIVLVCLLSADLDQVDPTAGTGERLGGLLLLAFFASGLVVTLLRGPAEERVQSAMSGLLVRSGLVGASALLLGALLSGARLNPLGDLAFLTGVLLVPLLALPFGYDPTAATDRFLARWAVPVGATALLLALPVIGAKVAALP